MESLNSELSRRLDQQLLLPFEQSVLCNLSIQVEQEIYIDTAALPLSQYLTILENQLQSLDDSDRLEKERGKHNGI
jgi:hypothetical protein